MVKTRDASAKTKKPKPKTKTQSLHSNHLEFGLLLWVFCLCPCVPPLVHLFLCLKTQNPRTKYKVQKSKTNVHFLAGFRLGFVFWFWVLGFGPCVPRLDHLVS